MNYQDALRKARYGHKDWIWWRDKSGQSQAERLSAGSMKRCLLDVGTKGDWTLISSDGTPMKGHWWIGVNVFRQCLRGWR